VLFHLVVLGVLALISTVDFPGGGSPSGVIGRVGVLLLILALAHGVTLGVLTRMREEQVVEDVSARVNAPVDRQIHETTVDPAVPRDGRYPYRTTSIDERTTYTTEP